MSGSKQTLTSKKEKPIIETAKSPEKKAKTAKKEAGNSEKKRSAIKRQPSHLVKRRTLTMDQKIETLIMEV